MILYFSGTGNSKYVAERVSEQLRESLSVLLDEPLGETESISLDARTGEPAPVPPSEQKNQSGPISLSELIKKGEPKVFESEEPYVFCYPTYAWRMPRFLEAYLKKCTFNGDRRAYFLTTCGDSVGASAEYARKFCEETGLEYMGLKAIVMPENYIAIFNCPSEEKSLEIIEKAKSSIDDTACAIKDRTVITDKPGSKLLSGIVNDFFYRFIVKAKAFHLEKECISCGLCAESCVLNNIRLVDDTAYGDPAEKKTAGETSADDKNMKGNSLAGKPIVENDIDIKAAGNQNVDGKPIGYKTAGGKPVWGDNCTHCMACITLCPTQAIEYGKKTQKKRRYRCPV